MNGQDIKIALLGLSAGLFGLVLVLAGLVFLLLGSRVVVFFFVLAGLLVAGVGVAITYFVALAPAPFQQANTTPES